MSIDRELEQYLTERAQQLETERGETPFERQQRLSQSFAEAIAPALAALDTPTDAPPHDGDTFADQFRTYIENQEH